MSGSRNGLPKSFDSPSVGALAGLLGSNGTALSHWGWFERSRGLSTTSV
jgi:hypothetical protein